MAGLLSAAGHRVTAPDLPGHGGDRTPTATITLESYVDAVENCIDGPAVLVGHSFGGAVIARACERRPESARAAVYVCAFMLRNGESVWSNGRATAGALGPQNLRVDERLGTVDLDPAVVPRGFYNGCPAEDRNRGVSLWRPEPLAPLRTPLELTDRRWGTVPRAYVRCTADGVIPLATQRRMCRLSPCTIEIEMSTGHTPMLADPRRLADNLMLVDKEI